MSEWKELLPSTEVLCDKYAWRYVEKLENACSAFLYYPNSCEHGETVIFKYSDYRSPSDAIKAAKLWTMKKGGLEQTPSGDFSYKLALGRYVERSPRVIRQAW